MCRRKFKTDIGEPLEVTDYQVDIIQTICWKERKRALCTASTRAGKSLAVALAVILLAQFSPGEKIRLIAPTLDHTKIVMGYVIQHILDNKAFTNNLMFDVKGLGAERLKKEMTKQKLTLKNGSEIMSITANIAGQGRSLVGWGGSCIIVDEAEQIEAELMRTKVMRMLGDTPDANIFMIGNPVTHGYMWEKSTDPNWYFHKISWEMCVDEGRMSHDFVMERKGEMTQTEFSIWYAAEWPEELTDQLFTMEDLTNFSLPLSKEEKELLTTKPDEKSLGCDIARFGIDLTVLYKAVRYEDTWFFTKCKTFEKKDLMGTVGEIVAWDRIEKFDRVIVDDSGLGGGVTDRLREIEGVGLKVHAFIAGESPHKLKRKLLKKEEENNKQFMNKKAFQYRQFESKCRKKQARCADLVNGSKLLGEMRKMRYEYNSSGKLKVVDPEDKSPDFCDAACYALFEGQRLVFSFI